MLICILNFIIQFLFVFWQRFDVQHVFIKPIVPLTECFQLKSVIPNHNSNPSLETNSNAKFEITHGKDRGNFESAWLSRAMDHNKQLGN